MNFQLISDIHLEFYNNYPTFPILSNQLFLAGDIGYPFESNYLDFIKYCSYHYDKVFYVSGNHEYYKNNNPVKTMNEINEQIQLISQLYPNFIYLNRLDHYLYNDYMIIGRTLWTYRPIQYKYFFYNNVNDYKNIFITKIQKQSFTKEFNYVPSLLYERDLQSKPLDRTYHIFNKKKELIKITNTNNLAKLHFNHIQNEVLKYPNHNIIIMSHHNKEKKYFRRFY